MRRFAPRVLLFSIALAAGAAAQAAPRPITETDLLKFRWVADPRISPDGKDVAYVLVTVNEKEDRYDTNLWIVNTSGTALPRRLTAGPRDTAPRWSPDGQTLAFLRAEEKEKPQIHLLPMRGGEARKLTDLPKGASAAVWSPSGRTIAFTSGTTEKDLKERDKAREEKKQEKKEEKPEVRVILRAVYRQNGEGWLDPERPPHVWTVPVVSTETRPAEPKRLTSGSFGEENLFWSRDGSRIYFTSDRVAEPYYAPPDANLYAVPAEGGEIEQVVDMDGEINPPSLSPDGRSFAFSGFVNPAQQQSHTQDDVFVHAAGKISNLTAGYDYEIGSNLAGDQRPPRGGSPRPIVWAPDGSKLYLVTTEKGRSNLVALDIARQRVEPLTTGNHDVIAYTATPDARSFAVTLADATRLGDLYLLEMGSKKLTQLTRVNEELFSELAIAPPEEIWYDSFDGKKINGWIVKPPGFDPTKKYPFIVQIHGGPHTAYGHTFTHEFLWMAAAGYVVLYTNPRGSTSYGQDFANVIQYRYPGDDYRDIMLGVDEVVKRGYVDEKRMGVTGGSGGGLLTNWTVTQTNRFAAAVSQRSVADWLAFWYTADFSLFTPSWFRSTPFQDPEEFLARSPVNYAEKITTPMMFIEGDADLRTPAGQGGEAMFRALKAQRKTAVMVRFPGETHELSRSGKPSFRLERLRHIVGWFDKYLLGKTTTAYDLR